MYVTWPNEGIQPFVQHINDYTMHGVPKGVRE